MTIKLAVAGGNRGARFDQVFKSNWLRSVIPQTKYDHVGRTVDLT